MLAERFPEIATTQPELLAHHYTAAELHAQAVTYWQRAGDQASKRSAYVEAISHLTQGSPYSRHSQIPPTAGSKNSRSRSLSVPH